MEEKEIIEDFQKVKEVEKPNYEELEVEVNRSAKAVELATRAINEKVKEIEDVNNKYLRALADYQNLKRISDGIIAKSKDNGKIEIIKSLLPIIDDFDKAKEAGELLEGVGFIYDKFISMLSANGVETINPQAGDKFDDSVHEAVAGIPSDSEENKNTITFTQFKGYKMGDTIIRFAKVGVYV